MKTKKAIQSIDTVYDGYRFRSRLEAKWAMFFNEAGIEYSYEPKGIKTSYGWYLADFFIPSMDLWIDVKGNAEAEPFALNKLAEICEEGQRGAIIENIPLVKNNSINPFESKDFKLQHNVTFGEGTEDGLYLFCSCIKCGAYGFEYEGRSARIECGCDHSDISNGDRSHNYDSPNLLKAYKVARGARFEHDERKFTYTINQQA